MSGSTVLQSFMILKFLLLKWRLFQYNVKYGVWFFTFSCRYGIFVKHYMKKLSIFNVRVWNPFQDLPFCQVLQSRTCYYKNGGPFNITQNLEKIVFMGVFVRILIKSLWKNYFCWIQFCKVRVRIYCIANFQDLKPSTTKMTAVWI